MVNKATRNFYLISLRKQIAGNDGKVGLSQSNAAVMLGVDLRTYQRWEACEVEIPRSALIVMELAGNNKLPTSYLP